MYPLRGFRMALTEYNYFETTHFIRRCKERSISLTNVKAAIESRENRKFQQKGRHGGRNYRIQHPIKGGHLVVVAEIRKHDCWLISAFFKD